MVIIKANIKKKSSSTIGLKRKVILKDLKMENLLVNVEKNLFEEIILLFIKKIAIF